MVIEYNGKFRIKVKGVWMTELIDNEWHVVEYNTREEAEQELERYREFWRD